MVVVTVMTSNIPRVKLGDNTVYRPLRILTAFWQVTHMAADKVQATINRVALLAADYVVIPLGADLLSLHGLSNLGPTLSSWKNLWKKRLTNWQDNPEHAQHPGFKLPVGKMQPVGYLCQQHGMRVDRPVRANDKWVPRIRAVHRQAVLNEPEVIGMKQEADPHCLATIKHYRNLIPMGQEHRKPIYKLTSADGAIGSHANAVTDARQDFKRLAIRIANQIGMRV